MNMICEFFQVFFWWKYLTSQKKGWNTRKDCFWIITENPCKIIWGCRTCVGGVKTEVTNHLRKMFRSRTHKAAERVTAARINWLKQCRIYGGPGPRVPHHVHVLSHMCDICVPFRHFYRWKFFVDAFGSILCEYYLALWRNNCYTNWFSESQSGIWI